MKKLFTSILLSLIIISQSVSAGSVFAETAFTISPDSNDSLTNLQLDQITSFLVDYQIIKKCLRNRAPQEDTPLNAYTTSCIVLQVFHQADLSRRQAWEKIKDLGLLSPSTGRAKKLTALQYLSILFDIAGVTISPLSESNYRTSLRKIRFRLNNENFRIIATAFEKGLIPEPRTAQKGRELRNKLLNNPITIIDALAFLFQLSTSEHSRPTIINITPYAPQFQGISLENTLREIIDTIKTQSYFSESFDEKKAMEAAIKALVKSLDEDKYIEYYTEQEYANFTSSINGNLEGIGAYIEEQNNRIIIVTPIEGSPADKVGLLPGDLITHIDGISTDGLSLQEAVQMIRGAQGTQVKLRISRNNQSLSFTITRQQINIPSLSTSSQNGFEIIKIIQFTANSSFETEQALKAAVDKNPKGIILDLRNNPGGLLNEVVTIVDFFLDKGEPIVYLQDHNERISIDSTIEPLVKNIPIAVLINKGSASASEILAGALQGHKIAKIYGETSFGKGTVQNIIPLQENLQSGLSAFKLTTAEYLVPGPNNSVISIDGIGVIPDSNPPNYNNTLLDDPNTPQDEALDTVINSLGNRY